jgi:ABC-type phosphate transport system permease subunit
LQSRDAGEDSLKNEIITPRKAKKINIQFYITQGVNAILTFILGIVSVNRRREERYIPRETSYPTTYPTIINWNKSVLFQYSPLLAGFVINIINGIYLFLFRRNKEVKMWIKIMIVGLTGLVLIICALFPARNLSPILVPTDIVTNDTFYGVYKGKKRPKLIK